MNSGIATIGAHRNNQVCTCSGFTISSIPKRTTNANQSAAQTRKVSVATCISLFCRRGSCSSHWRSISISFSNKANDKLKAQACLSQTTSSDTSHFALTSFESQCQHKQGCISYQQSNDTIEQAYRHQYGNWQQPNNIYAGYR